MAIRGRNVTHPPYRDPYAHLLLGIFAQAVRDARQKRNASTRASALHWLNQPEVRALAQLVDVVLPSRDVGEADAVRLATMPGVHAHRQRKGA